MSFVSSPLVFVIVILCLIGKQAVWGPQKVFARLAALFAFSGLFIVVLAELSGDQWAVNVGRAVMWVGMLISAFMFSVAIWFGLRQYLTWNRDKKELTKATCELIELESKLQKDVRLESDKGFMDELGRTRARRDGILDKFEAMEKSRDGQ